MHLYDEWRALLDLSEVRPTLEMVRDNRLVGDDLQKLLTDDEEATLAIGQKQFNHDEILKMRNHVVAILNFFEQVAVARRDNIGDAKMIDAYIGVAIMDHYNALRPFMAEWENKKARRAWIPLDTAATEYWGDRLEGGRNPI